MGGQPLHKLRYGNGTVVVGELDQGTKYLGVFVSNQ